MNTATFAHAGRPSALPIDDASRVRSVDRTDGAISESTVEGTFSLLSSEPLTLAARPGLTIHVLAGCLWVPHHDEHCSVGIGAGEHFVVRRSGELTTLASRGTQLRLEWPPSSRAGLH